MRNQDLKWSYITYEIIKNVAGPSVKESPNNCSPYKTFRCGVSAWHLLLVKGYVTAVPVFFRKLY